MPSSDECHEAAEQVRQWAIKSLFSRGHTKHSAKAIVHYMSYEERVKEAENYLGRPIYRGPYSPF